MPLLGGGWLKTLPEKHPFYYNKFLIDKIAKEIIPNKKPIHVSRSETTTPHESLPSSV
jgi:hypothetical protein